MLPADLVVEAIGQQVDAGVEAGAARDSSSRARAASAPREGSLETTRAGVFAAGDIVNGGTTVVQAVAEGARAAWEIHRYLEESDQ